ncbi:MAG: iron-containing alcohol dehydrogenase, partial [Planctomycetes bacterium]|nr:iron-containing alcohol dehydrogenase [Planctomycetota bacterium]
ARLTAATGLDALSHCIEAYVSTKDNPLLDPMILHGIELIGNNLRMAVARGSSRDKAALDARLDGGVDVVGSGDGRLDRTAELRVLVLRFGQLAPHPGVVLTEAAQLGPVGVRRLVVHDPAD